MLAEEVGWIFLGFVIGVLAGIPIGYIIAQIVIPRGSIVKVERDEKGYSIIEKPLG